jgi:hypothetical protein
MPINLDYRGGIPGLLPGLIVRIFVSDESGQVYEYPDFWAVAQKPLKDVTRIIIAKSRQNP